MNNTWNWKYFYGVEIPEEDIKAGYISYYTLAQSFDAVLCNNIAQETPEDLEIVHGSDYDEETDTWEDIYQYYIIDDEGYRILSEETDEIIYYHNALDVYVWGVTHFGTPWRSVSTGIKIDIKED